LYLVKFSMQETFFILFRSKKAEMENMAKMIKMTQKKSNKKKYPLAKKIHSKFHISLSTKKYLSVGRTLPTDK
jgi:hypothetical protein